MFWTISGEFGSVWAGQVESKQVLIWSSFLVHLPMPMSPGTSLLCQSVIAEEDGS